MKDSYLKYLEENKIPDYLVFLDISFSKKFEFLTNLAKFYSIKEVIAILDMYKREYMDVNRVIYPAIFNTMKAIGRVLFPKVEKKVFPNSGETNLK